MPKRKNAEVDLAASRGTDQQLAVGHNEEPKWSLHSSENNLHIFRRCTDVDGNPSLPEKKIRLQGQDANDIVTDWSKLPSEIWLKCWKMFQWKTKRNARLVCRHWNQFFEKHFPFRCHSLKLTVEPKSADVAVCPGWQFVEGFTPRGSPIMCPLKRLDGLLKRIVFADEFDGDDDLFTINFQLLCGMIKNDAVLRAVWQSKLRPVNVIIAGNRRKMRYSLKIALGILHHSGKLKSIRLKDTVASWRWKECMIDAEILRPGLHLEILNPKKGENLICLTSFVNFIRLDKDVQLEGVVNLDLHFIQMAVKQWKSLAMDEAQAEETIPMIPAVGPKNRRYTNWEFSTKEYNNETGLSAIDELLKSHGQYFGEHYWSESTPSYRWSMDIGCCHLDMILRTCFDEKDN